MQIQIDSREHAKQIARIVSDFDRFGVKHFISKLYIGDYMNMDNPRVVIDRKQNCSELANNLFAQHRRFYDEVRRAKEHGIKLIILCEHGGQIHNIDDVREWNNPRLKTYPNSVTGRTLSDALFRLHISYGVDILFCDKRQTGTKIIELLGAAQIEKRDNT